MQYSIIQKSQLEGGLRLDVEDWFKYIKPIYEKRKNLKNTLWDGFGLIYTIDNNRYERLKNLIEKVAKNVKNFEQIFEIASQLKDKDADDRIDDMISELRAASYLIDRGYEKIEYQKRKLDFKCKKDKEEFLVEVKFVRGPDFKTQERVYLAYKLSPDKPIDIFNRKYIEAKQQFINHKVMVGSQMIILVTSLLESDKFWFGDTVENWRRNQDIKTVILTNGDIYE